MSVKCCSFEWRSEGSACVGLPVQECSHKSAFIKKALGEAVDLQWGSDTRSHQMLKRGEESEANSSGLTTKQR